MMDGLHSRARALIAMAKAKLSLANAYQTVYESPDGRLVMLDIMREARILSVAHVDGDPGASSFNDGARSIGLYICERLRWSEGELIELARQQTSDQLEEG